MQRKRKKSVKKTKQWIGGYSAKGKKFGIVVSRFNEYLTEQLLEGALEVLLGHGAREKDIHVVRVPGAFEIPLATQKLISKVSLDAVVTLAVVIKGKTKHFEQVVVESAKGVRELMQKTEVPIILGVIPATSELDAIKRVGIKQMNKGREWGLSAIEMADLCRKMGKK